MLELRSLVQRFTEQERRKIKGVSVTIGIAFEIPARRAITVGPGCEIGGLYDRGVIPLDVAHWTEAIGVAPHDCFPRLATVRERHAVEAALGETDDDALRSAARACDGSDAAGCEQVAGYARAGQGDGARGALLALSASRGCLVGSSELCRLAAEVLSASCADNGASCTLLGAIRHDGLDGGEVDLPAALVWFERACEADDGEGCFRAGAMRSAGEGAPEDFDEARRLWDLACDRGYRGLHCEF